MSFTKWGRAGVGGVFVGQQLRRGGGRLAGLRSIPAWLLASALLLGWAAAVAAQEPERLAHVVARLDSGASMTVEIWSTGLPTAFDVIEDIPDGSEIVIGVNGLERASRGRLQRRTTRLATPGTAETLILTTSQAR